MKGFFISLTVLVAASSALGLSYMLSVTEPSWASSNDDDATSNLGINTTTTSKELTVALLTDALFSDAGWGALVITPRKHYILNTGMK